MFKSSSLFVFVQPLQLRRLLEFCQWPARDAIFVSVYDATVLGNIRAESQLGGAQILGTLEPWRLFLLATFVMAASPIPNGAALQPQEKWNDMDDHPRDVVMPAQGDVDNGGHLTGDDRVAPQTTDGADYARGGSVAGDGANPGSSAKSDAGYRGEKQIKPNKVYIGGLPEHTRKEDLESCFGKIGTIVNIELKVGYGFVEFESREAAEESVAKYHEGYFMGNKIRVELSHGGGRTAKYSGDPGACFKCGQVGHWARECPNHMPNGNHRRPHPIDAPLIDRIQPPRDYPPSARDYPPYRDDYARYPPRDVRYGYDFPPPLPGRDFRRPPSPPREFRDYPPPSVRSGRDYDDFRMRGPPPPPPPPVPSARYESRSGYYPPEADAPPGYPPRSYGPPPPRDYYERYERRPPPPSDRYPYPPPAAARPRTPPGGPVPRSRDDYDRPPRDYVAPPPEVRGRPASPPPSRYADYPPRAGSSEAPAARYRRRSQSPPARSASNGYDSAAYQGGSGAPYNGGSSGGFAGSGYANGSSAPPPRGSGSGRDYPARSSRDVEPSGGYRRP
ncbi:uncharacterized protein FIBRA_02373 [Fibroporia radiculosa]|uniref:RNA-binding domain-containing protein n=1 Tax=Fibroporia radiculosa TaxID=599839 RepID=J4G1N1_9APHY|nr:uncharacterized protein FIBRA_02373 [Fibroporia radiculosa]CCM00343.1 predicted protein [Fibroporia radiculosa]